VSIDDEQDRPVCVLGHPEPVEAFQGWLCRRHYHWLGGTLRQIEELFALTVEVLLPGPANGGERHGTRDGSPAPGRVIVMALSDKRARDWRDDPDAIPDVAGALDSWIRLIDEERLDDNGESTLNLEGYNGTVSAAIRVLGRERHWMSQQAWVDDYAADLAALHRHVASAVGDSMWPRPVGRCPNDQAPLYNTIGVDEVTCRRCKYTWTGIALVRLRLIHEQDAAKRKQAT
jgi:hypothetical protein